MTRIDVFRMIKRRALAAGLPYSTCCHTFRATGITAYLEAGAAGWENSFFHRRPEPFILIFPHALKRLAISRRDHDVMLDASTAGLRIRDGQPDVLGSHVPECE